MIMPKSSDLLQTGTCTGCRLRWSHVDATDSARALGQAHLCGPTAGLVLGEALGGVALLSEALTEPEETLVLRMRVQGPVQGVLVEASRDGSLRGYPQIKVMNALDGQEEISSAPAWGDSGKAAFIRSVPGRILAQAAVDVSPASVEGALNRYLNLSLQRQALAILLATEYDGEVDLVRAFFLECLPDGDQAEFNRLRARALDGSLRESLEFADGAAALCADLGLADVICDAPRPLRFACRCSESRALQALAALSAAELREMAGASKAAGITCHLCGRTYPFAPDVLFDLALANETGRRGGAPDA